MHARLIQIAVRACCLPDTERGTDLTVWKPTLTQDSQNLPGVGPAGGRFKAIRLLCALQGRRVIAQCGQSSLPEPKSQLQSQRQLICHGEANRGNSSRLRQRKLQESRVLERNFMGEQLGQTV